MSRKLINTAEYELLKLITPSQNVELVSYELFDSFRRRNPQYVGVGELKSSHTLLVSQNFLRCQGVCLADPERNAGALLHNSPIDNPYFMLDGTGPQEYAENPKDIFNAIEKVVAVNVYSQTNHAFPRETIDDALRQIGVKKSVHIPIRHKNSHTYGSRHIVHDVKEGAVYIFMNDFQNGIKYSLF